MFFELQIRQFAVVLLPETLKFNAGQFPAGAVR